VHSNSYSKVDFERVPDLVEKRRVFLRAGKAFIPVSEQQSLIVAEFSTNLELALEVHILHKNSLTYRKPPERSLVSMKTIAWSPYSIT
jgi:DNA primase large subunit